MKYEKKNRDLIYWVGQKFHSPFPMLREATHELFGQPSIFQMDNLDLCFKNIWGTRGQIVNTFRVIEKAREFLKNIYFCFIDYTTKAFDCVDHNRLWKILQEMGIPDHLTCLLRNWYVGQEATVRAGYGKTDSFQIGKGVPQGYILSPCLLPSCKILGWIKHKLKSKLPGEIAITSDMQMTPPLWQKEKKN